MKFLKILITIILFLIIMILLALGAFVLLVDPNKVKSNIEIEVQKRTGYLVTIDSKMSWSFYPYFGIKIPHMMIRADSKSSPFIDLQNMNIRTTLSSLLTKKNLHTDVFVENIQLEKIHASDVRIGVNWQDQTLLLQPITAKVYDGTLAGTAQGLDLAFQPRWQWDIHANNVQLKPLLQDVIGKNSVINLSGTTDISIKANTVGKTRTQFIQNLNGVTTFKVSSGTLEGIDINYFIQTADALIHKQPLTSPTFPAKTSFESLAGKALIANGIVSTQNLSLISQAFSVQAKGSLSLLLQTLQLELQVSSNQNLKTQWRIPIMITGKLSHPNVQVDLDELQKLIVNTEIDKIKTKAQEEIQAHIPPQAADFLQRLLKP